MRQLLDRIAETLVAGNIDQVVDDLFQGLLVNMPAQAASRMMYNAEAMPRRANGRRVEEGNTRRSYRVALGTGFACAVVATNYPQVMAPPYAAVLGVIVLYPAMVTVWWHVHRPGGGRR
jgi:hypothetical protein